ncbi:DNA-directed RNA polymerase [Candidatus Pacearchaeota archaeon]|nr:DNA-directed RNA polymerase [Candidatus Pacearchaeota archaeon]
MEGFNRGPRRSFGGNTGGRRPGFKRDFGPREMHKAVCSDCKKECEVPFKPREDRPVYCKDCYAKHRDQ